MTRGVAAALLLALAPLPAAACGPDSDCEIPSGSYRIALPDRPERERPGAVLYLHGWQDAPEGVMGFEALRRTVDGLGAALIVPRGEGRSWRFPFAGRGGRDDVAFVVAVADDAAARFGLDRDRVLVTGFSIGGSLAWYVACREGTGFAGYAPIAGTFWEPYVPDCARPLPEIRHVHGRTDGTFPLEGRRVGGGAVQGDTRRAFALLREFAGCEGALGAEAPDGPLACRRQRCGGAVQELCLHDGGHSIRPEWIARAWHALVAGRPR